MFLPRLTNNILSTAQQVWLQKLGGAKTHDIQSSNDSVIQELSKKQISSVETTTINVVPKEVKEQTPDGPRPGDRLINEFHKYCIHFLYLYSVSRLRFTDLNS